MKLKSYRQIPSKLSEDGLFYNYLETVWKITNREDWLKTLHNTEHRGTSLQDTMEKGFAYIADPQEAAKLLGRTFLLHRPTETNKHRTVPLLGGKIEQSLIDPYQKSHSILAGEDVRIAAKEWLMRVVPFMKVTFFHEYGFLFATINPDSLKAYNPDDPYFSFTGKTSMAAVHALFDDVIVSNENKWKNQKEHFQINITELRFEGSK